MEPHVDAFSVESVIALGQDPTRFPVLELREANWAVHRVRVGHGGEGEDGERGDHGGVEAARGRRRSRRRPRHDGVHVEDKVGAAAADGVVAAVAASAVEVPAGVDVDAKHYDDDNEENDNGD